MSTPPGTPEATPAAALSEAQRAAALARYTTVIAPHLYEQLPLAAVAAQAGVPVRTAQRWLARYRQAGLSGLARAGRSDCGGRRIRPELIALVEGLALRRPRPRIATIHRQAAKVAATRGWVAPAYSTVHAIITGLDPGLVTLAQHGPAAYRDRFELVYRREADRPNALWQADHTELDVLVLDANGGPARPWLTAIEDDHSRAVPGYTVFLGAPSALQTSLALRQAIWRKPDPAWAVCGIPDVLYIDHGSDFTSTHLTQAMADLHIEPVYSGLGRPQGRGKIERFLGGVTTELLPELPGHLVRGKPVTPPRLTLPELDAAIGRWIVGTYHQRPHRETGREPQRAWLADGWLPRMPESLEELDLLLVMVAKPRTVQRDGIHFQGLRYLDPVLAAYVGEPVTIRYDPRDLAEIRVFHRNQFLCRAINPDHASETITLKDIQAARTARRRALRGQLNERIATATGLLAPHHEQDEQHEPPTPPPSPPRPERAGRRLYTYLEDKP